MDLLKKTKKGKEVDGIEKPPMFPVGTYLEDVIGYRMMWDAVTDQNLVYNLGYRMQYLDYLIKMYNTYDIDLAAGSLHIQNIRATIASIIDSVLYNMVESACNSANYNFDRDREFRLLIVDACEFEIIDEDMQQELQSLRIDADKSRFATLAYRELDAYTVDDANKAIDILNRFIEQTQPEPKSITPKVTPLA